MYRIVPAFMLVLIGFASMATANIYTVNSISDRPDASPGSGGCNTGFLISGPGGAFANECTFRAALEEANARAGADNVRFSTVFLTSSDIVLTLLSALPQITDPVTIEGYSAVGFNESNPNEYPAVRIEPDDGIVIPGLVLSSGAGSSVIQGLALNGFAFSALQILGDNNVVQGSHIGIGPINRSGNGGNGIEIAGNTNVIGKVCGAGTCSGRGNVISASTENGIFVEDGQDNQIYGNRIGTNPQGTSASANGFGTGNATGLAVGLSASDTLIGSRITGSGNLISGNSGSGILIGSGTTTVQGNFIGTNVSGAAAIPNGEHGILVTNPGDNQIGGALSSDGNLISGNNESGVFVLPPGPQICALPCPTVNREIRGNIIGLNIDETEALPNGDYGIGLSDTSSWLIQSNTIAGNAFADFGTGCDVTHISILSNTIGTNPDGDLSTSYNNRAAMTLCGYGHEIGRVAQGNVISGTYAGITIINSDTNPAPPDSKNALIRSNWIGTDPIARDLGGLFGVLLEDTFAEIGAAPNEEDDLQIAAQGNLIANQSLASVVIQRDALTPPGGTSVRGNLFAGDPPDVSIRLRTQGQIDCLDGGGSCALPNDFGDTDLGPNQQQNFPDFDATQTQLNPSTGEVEVRYRVDSNLSDSSYPLQIDFYVASVDFEGVDLYLGSDTYASADVGSFRNVAIEPVDPFTPVEGYLRATATDSEGNTSQMSEQLITVPEPGVGTGLFAGVLGLVGLAGHQRRMNRLL
ncbi:MAG: hypothetical protein P8M78_15745 [Myxococcota bacterium]|nr:hypothetical protein [Myxococcota bacterium]